MSYVVPVKSVVEILQNLVAFSEYINFNFQPLRTVTFDIQTSNFDKYLIAGWTAHDIRYNLKQSIKQSKLLGKNISSENKQPVFIQILFGLPLEPEGPLQIHLLHQKHDLVRLSSFTCSFLHIYLLTLYRVFHIEIDNLTK